jgi:thioredoxin reductase (NADPH)
MEILDILIIGAGPIGINCAIEAQKNNLKYVIIEKGTIVNSCTTILYTCGSFQRQKSWKLTELPLSLQLPNREDRMLWNIIRNCPAKESEYPSL